MCMYAHVHARVLVHAHVHAHVHVRVHVGVACEGRLGVSQNVSGSTLTLQL